MTICDECKGVGGLHRADCSIEYRKVAEASFTIHPSHRVTPSSDTPVVCENCGASWRQDLEARCWIKKEKKMVSENFARITVDLVGLDETKAMLEEAMRAAFFAGFANADQLWEDQVGAELGGSPKFSDEEITARFEFWKAQGIKQAESEAALYELRKKLSGDPKL